VYLFSLTYDHPSPTVGPRPIYFAFEVGGHTLGHSVDDKIASDVVKLRGDHAFSCKIDGKKALVLLDQARR
jgi:hypothetical protein